MKVTLYLTPHILRNCRTADEVAERMATWCTRENTEGAEIVSVYPMPAAQPEGNGLQYDVTILIKRTVPVIEGSPPQG